MSVYEQDNKHYIHITELVDGVRITHDRLATQAEIDEYNQKLLDNSNRVYAEEYKELLDEMVELDYLTTRHYEQKHIVAVAGVIDNPKYEDGLSLDNGEILAVFQAKQTKRNRVNEIESECGLTKAELLDLL